MEIRICNQKNNHKYELLALPSIFYLPVLKQVKQNCFLKKQLLIGRHWMNKQNGVDKMMVDL